MRKEIDVKIESGRDAGKIFKITEMPATQGERWATRALGVLGRSGMGIAVLGTIPMEQILEGCLKAKPDEVEPLMDELLACASYNKDGTSIVMKGSMIDSVVEEIPTIMRLKMEALKLMLGFLAQGGESGSE